jgi:hypothetical protein
MELLEREDDDAKHAQRDRENREVSRTKRLRANIATIVSRSAATATPDEVLPAPSSFASSTAAALLLTYPPRKPLR